MDEDETVEEESCTLPRFFLRGKGAYQVIMGVKGKKAAQEALLDIKAKCKPLFGGAPYTVEKETATKVVCDKSEDSVSSHSAESESSHSADSHSSQSEEEVYEEVEEHVDAYEEAEEEAPADY